MAKVVFKIGDDVSTDTIYPGRFMATVLPTETPQYCFADVGDFNKTLRDGAVPPGSVVVADRNFGTGSSREQAASCLKGWELVVVANNYQSTCAWTDVWLIAPDGEATMILEGEPYLASCSIGVMADSSYTLP